MFTMMNIKQLKKSQENQIEIPQTTIYYPKKFYILEFRKHNKTSDKTQNMNNLIIPEKKRHKNSKFERSDKHSGRECFKGDMSLSSGLWDFFALWPMFAFWAT